MNCFPQNARVCFVGDSITHNNRFVAHIVAYYRKHFPELKVEFYNCGISGGTLTTTLNSFDEDIAPLCPTHVVLMIGINDSNRSALKGAPEQKYETLKNAFERYKINLDKFCQRIKDMGAALTLCTPAPYAEYIESDEEPFRGGSALLLGYADYVKAYAKENGYNLCDYHSYMTKAMQTESLYNPDRVHPLPRGQYYMAKCFLEFQGLDLGDEAELPEDIAKWNEIVAKVRDTIATEHFILEDDFTTTDEQRIKAIKNYLENPTGPSSEYFTQLAKAYQVNKPHQEEYKKFVIDFMKNQ